MDLDPEQIFYLCWSNSFDLLHIMLAEIIRLIESRIQLDEGQRGIRALIQPNSALFSAARELSGLKSIGILTGFPCIQNNNPPIENDGIGGTLAIARAIESCGGHSTILIDSPYVEVIKNLSDWHNLQYGSHINVSSSRNLEFDGIVSIERSGRAKDGNYYTMRGRNISNLLEPLDVIYMEDKDIGVKVGIGDGGNEAGMGNLIGLVERYIPNGELIACNVRCHHPIVSSVSTWGGYGLAFAMCLCKNVPAVVNNAQERQIAEKICELNIRDGVTGLPTVSIDGLDWSVTDNIITDLSRLANS
ncbi:unnamed protein product [Blepharisma stoltei]|uniref:D-glutamate cyclase-like C-terminal domain-containing protein n=1 Tax=Blepharisma stoltei TaxID=1481888 RepID=A0AAU9JLR5_9CILI|nr:unnamed protein product [Blepharisma stoltei]